MTSAPRSEQPKQAIQTITGKAFEYALLLSLKERLERLTTIEVVDNDPYRTARTAYEHIPEELQQSNLLSASFAVNLLIDLEPRLSYGLSSGDVLQLAIVADGKGEEGDVRDVLAVRSSQDWEIGISAKHNHKAVKHPRLSDKIDFALKWLGVPCSPEYMQSMRDIFAPLSALRKSSGKRALWSDLGDYHTTVYRPVLEAFCAELRRIDQLQPGYVAGKLVEYMIGREDFYKVIKLKDKVEVQAYNLSGTLNKPQGEHKPKAKVPRLKLPKHILNISYAEGSETTLLVVMDEGWQMSFRIHNASSRIEPSLKFDIQLISSPSSLFVHQLFI